MCNSLPNVNSQTTSTSYSYPSSNPTVQVTLPLHTGSYTSQSSTNSSCTNSSTLPCFEIDSKSYLYNTVQSATFYDSLGRAVETRTPGPGSGYDTLVITTYNDQAHSVWQSVPFEVTHGTGWVDPNGLKDYQGVTPGGTVTFYDALGRAISQGSIDRWIDLWESGGKGKLSDLVKRFCPHIGQESFFELM